MSPRTDVYSLGCVLFEALTGQTPYQRENDVAKLWAHVYTAPPSVREISPDISPQFDDVLQRAMAKDPGERYASAGELGRAVLAAARGAEAPAQQDLAPVATPSDQPVSQVPDQVPEPRRARVPSRRALVGLVGVLILVSAVVAVVSLTGSDDEPTTADRATPAAASPPLRTASAWRPVPPMPTARQNMASTLLDGTIWVIGGLGAGSKGLQRVEGYDPVINGWKSGPDLPIRLHHEMAVTYKGEAVVIGGWIPKGSDPSAEVTGRMLALRGGKWVNLPSLHWPRAAGAAAVVGDRIVVVGGQAAGRLVEATEIFDGKRWRIGANIPTPREHLAAASDGKFVYAVGGRALSPDKNSAALERYDPSTNKWQRLPDMPTARGGLGAAIAEGHLFAVGGETPTDVMGEVESYNLAKKTWSNAPSMRTPRHGIRVASIERSLYAIGGARKPGHASATPTTEVLRLTR